MARGVRTYRTIQKSQRSKYGNIKCKIDGYTFDSQKEGRRYAELKILLRQGLISDLELQKEFELQPAFRDNNGKWVRAIRYKADFCYTDNETGRTIVEDVKSEATRKDAVYTIKKKMMAYRGIIIKEV
jgi:hypothetical protein